jgi:hypothetical protein
VAGRADRQPGLASDNSLPRCQRTPVHAAFRSCRGSGAGDRRRDDFVARLPCARSNVPETYLSSSIANGWSSRTTPPS